MSSGSSLPAPGSKLLSHFRASKQRLPLHPLEKAVLTAVAIHLCFLPWALGTMHPWSQITSLVLTTLGLLIALMPRNYTSDLSGGQAFRLHPFARLIRFPIFWIGLALLGYIALQAYNPSWVWERNERTWWLRRVTDIEWLPTSIDTPFERFNIWRQFIIYASAWLTMCTVWIGFTRRRGLELLLIILALNGVILAITGFIWTLYAPDGWWVLLLNKPLPGASPFSSFIYKNHAGGWFSIMTGVTVALAAFHFEQGQRKFSRSTPAMLWLLGAALLAFAVFFTYSRGALLLLVGYLVAATTYFMYRVRSTARKAIAPLIWVSLTAILVCSIAFGASQLNYNRAKRNFASLFENQSKDSSVAQRLDAYKAGRSMLADHWTRGVGAGGFRFLYPEYIKHYPASYKNGQLFWEHAHCDWLQLPIELGAAGTLLILLGGIYVFSTLGRLKLWRHTAMSQLVLAGLLTLAHALIDFPFQNPAILTTWLSLMILSVRWTELEAA